MGETTIENIDFKEKLDEIERFIEQNNTKKEQLSDKLEKIEMESSRKKEIERKQTSKMKEFDVLKTVEDKKKFICENKDSDLFNKLKKNDFFDKDSDFKDNSFVDYCKLPDKSLTTISGQTRSDQRGIVQPRNGFKYRN